MSSAARKPRLTRGVTFDKASSLYVHQTLVERFKTVEEIYAALDAHEKQAVSSLTAAAPAKAAALC